MTVDRRAVKKFDGVTFSKLLGCGHGVTFTPTDVDLHRWGLLVCIADENIGLLDRSKAIKNWQVISDSEFRVILDPTSSHGLWSNVQPFQLTNANNLPSEPLIAITRARIAPRRYLTFLKAVPRVVSQLHSAPGLIRSFGIGEAPIGLQGTFSMWRDEASLLDFAFRDSDHLDAIKGSHRGKWFSEELFARFSVREMRGSL